jgi:hypothetical protein
MNEGWASYWHARLLREADFLPSDLYLSAIKAHSDVVRPYAGDNQLSLSINPYHLGFSIWEDLIESRGIESARQICKEEDDFGFIRNYLSAELAEKLELFIYEADHEGRFVSPNRIFTRFMRQYLRRSSITAHPALRQLIYIGMVVWNWCMTIRTMAVGSISVVQNGSLTTSVESGADPSAFRLLGPAATLTLSPASKRQPEQQAN